MLVTPKPLLPAVVTVFKPYLFHIPLQCHSSQPLKVFSFLPWSYSRNFSFLSMSGIFVFAAGLEHCCLHASASTRGLKAVLRKLFPIHSSPLLFVIFFCTQGGSLVIFFPFCAAEVLPCQLKHKGIEQPAWIRARLLCRALPGPASPFDQHPPSCPRGRVRPLLRFSRTAGAALRQSGGTERFLSAILHRTPLASSCPECWGGGAGCSFLWSAVTWNPAAKHAFLSMVCCRSAQSPLWHASTAKNNVKSLFLLLAAGIQSWVQDGTSPSSLLMPLGWAKCHLIWDFTQLNPVSRTSSHDR